MIPVLCIEGQKGSGKSSLIQSLKRNINNCVISAPFRDIMPIVQKISPESETTFAFSQTPKGEQLLTDMLIQFIQNQIKKTKPHQWLILDRGWITGIRTIQGMNINPEEKQKQIAKWHTLKFPTVFIDTTLETIRQRRANMLNFDSGLDTTARLKTDMLERRLLAHQMPHQVIFLETKNLAPELIQNDIEKNVAFILSQIGGLK